MSCLGCASAITFWASRDVVQVAVLPGVAVAALAVLVPTVAARATPRQFGVGLLVGWIGGALAIVLFYVINLPRFGVDRTGVVVFGGTLLVLLIVTVLFAYAPPGSTEEPSPGARPQGR